METLMLSEPGASKSLLHMVAQTSEESHNLAALADSEGHSLVIVLEVLIIPQN